MAAVSNAKIDREATDLLIPRFDASGLITAVVVDSTDGAVLMVAHMNQQALELTLETMVAHFWSRSRQALWKKGETSGNVMQVEEILVDCDQDCIVLKCAPAGPACHTGQKTCFYRRVGSDGRLTQIDG